MEVASSAHAHLIVGATPPERRNFFLKTFAKGQKAGPDFLLIEPEKGRTTIGISQVRQLKRKIQLKAWGGLRKTVFIAQAQCLTTEAQNALLKALEEPPAATVFVLAAPSKDDLLPTVSSRCAVYQLKSGGLRDQTCQTAVAVFLNLLRRSGGERLAWVEANKELVGDKLKLVGYFNAWLSALRDLLLIGEGCENKILNKEILNSDLPPAVSRASLLASIQEAVETKRLLEETNVSPRLALEVFLLNLFPS